MKPLSAQSATGSKGPIAVFKERMQPKQIKRIIEEKEEELKIYKPVFEEALRRFTDFDQNNMKLAPDFVVAVAFGLGLLYAKEEGIKKIPDIQQYKLIAIERVCEKTPGLNNVSLTKLKYEIKGVPWDFLLFDSPEVGATGNPEIGTIDILISKNGSDGKSPRQVSLTSGSNPNQGFKRGTSNF